MGVESDFSSRTGCPVNALDLRLEAGKKIATAFERFQIVDHRARLGAQTFARTIVAMPWDTL
jgi:hypothetical protein